MGKPYIYGCIRWCFIQLHTAQIYFGQNNLRKLANFHMKTFKYKYRATLADGYLK